MDLAFEVSSWLIIATPIAVVALRVLDKINLDLWLLLASVPAIVFTALFFYVNLMVETGAAGCDSAAPGNCFLAGFALIFAFPVVVATLPVIWILTAVKAFSTRPAGVSHQSDQQTR